MPASKQVHLLYCLLHAVVGVADQVAATTQAGSLRIIYGGLGQVDLDIASHGRGHADGRDAASATAWTSSLISCRGARQARQAKSTNLGVEQRVVLVTA
jgi:hypothetical protein